MSARLLLVVGPAMRLMNVTGLKTLLSPMTTVKGSGLPIKMITIAPFAIRENTLDGNYASGNGHSAGLIDGWYIHIIL